MSKDKKILIAISLVVYIAGFSLILYELGIVASTGIFITLWASNIESKVKELK